MSNPNDESPGAPLAHQLRMFARKLKRRLRDQADTGDLTPSQTAVLLRLEQHGPATTSALARAEGMRSQSMGSIVATLEQAGLVVGSPDPADGRKTLLSLTEQCRHWISHGRAARQDWLYRTIETRLSPAEQERLAEMVPLLLRLVADRDDT
jgi:DNA-binding MarR family transcriptional regulator